MGELESGWPLPVSCTNSSLSNRPTIPDTVDLPSPVARATSTRDTGPCCLISFTTSDMLISRISCLSPVLRVLLFKNDHASLPIRQCRRGQTVRILWLMGELSV
ncbi:MAG: hypothetical protein BWY92_00949 [Firmicutes bacterium ADurb.BinA052]|nr:MAG: hypothetical protein BWY92_00949 [Firmicutes bacterium ADurb.BinA052]